MELLLPWKIRDAAGDRNRLRQGSGTGRYAEWRCRAAGRSTESERPRAREARATTSKRLRATLLPAHICANFRYDRDRIRKEDQKIGSQSRRLGLLRSRSWQG